MNTDVQRNLMIFFASGFFAVMLVSTTSAKSPRETANDTRTHINTGIAISRDVVSRVPIDDDLNSSKQDLPLYLADTFILKFRPIRSQRILFAIH